MHLCSLSPSFAPKMHQRMVKKDGDVFREFVSGFFRELCSRFSPVFAFASAGSALQALGAAERAGGRSTKASVTVTKGGNRKGIPLTRDFFAVVFSFTGFGFLWARFLVF